MKEIDLSSRGIDEHAAAELRARLEAFDDWNDPAMDMYDDYDAELLDVKNRASTTVQGVL